MEFDPLSLTKFRNFKDYVMQYYTFKMYLIILFYELKYNYCF